MTRFHPGGTERQMIELIRRLDRDRFHVQVVCYGREGSWLTRVTEQGATIAEFPIGGFARFGTAAQLTAFARWCRRKRIAVLQTCDLYTNIFGLPGAALAGVPIRIGSRRELNPDKSPAQIWLQRQAYRCATKIVANSPAARQMLEREGVAPGSIAVIPNGVDLASFADGGPPRPVRTMITVANLRPEKNHETLLAALARLVGQHPELRVRIVGDGPRRAELEAVTRTLKLQDHVEFLGHRDDVPALLQQADVFVLPSRSEAFPNSAIEAMAAGLPVVASAVGGLLDLIEDGRTGVLIPPGDPEQLAAALRRLMANPALAATIGQTARAEVQRRYSFDRMVTAFERLYVDTLRTRAVARTRRTEAAGI